MNIDRPYIDREFDSFIEYPTDDKRFVSTASAKLFAEHIAQPALLEAARLQSLVAEMLNELQGCRAEIAARTAQADSQFPDLTGDDDDQTVREFEESRIARLDALIARAKEA